MLTDPAQSTTSSSPTSRPPAKPRRGLRFLVFTALGLLAVIVIAVAILIVAPPASLLTPIIVKTVASQFGRELKIGTASYVFRTDFGVHFDNVTLSNPEGMTGADLLQAAGLDARINLASLLKGPVTVSELTVTQPVLTLHRDASGKANWALPPQNSNVRLSQVSLVKGSVNYQDELAGQSLQITDVTGSLSQKPAAQEAKISGTTVWRAEPITVDIDVADIQALAAGSASSVTMAATSKDVNANATGSVTTSDKGRFQGTFTVSTPSPADLARWLGSTTPTGVRLSATSFAGQIDATPTAVELQKAQLTLDGANSVWNVRLDLATKPALTGTIDVPVLDLTVLSGGAGPARAAELTPATPPITVVPAYQSLSSDLDKLDQQLGSAPPSIAPQSAAAPTTSLWSSEVIDLDALSTIDMDVKATAGRVHLDRIDATSGALAVSVKDGKLDMAIQQLEVDKGQISGRLQLQGGKTSQAQTAITVGADNVPVDAILKEFMASPALTGATKLNLSASGQGRTQRDLVSSLTGKASFSISSGAIAGFDLRNMVLEWWRSWSFDPSRKTEFSVLQGSYDIQKGDLRNASDLAFQGKDVDISSSGNINLATGALNQSVRLQLTPPPTHLPIPLKVSGTLTAPSVGFDWSSIFSSPATLGGPSQVALAPEPLPADIQQKVQNILTANADNPKLAPETRDALQSLLPSPPSSPDNSKN
jgi:AsmA protein